MRERALRSRGGVAATVVAAVCAVSLAWPPASRAASDEPARLLRAVPLAAPIELAGVELKPEVSVSIAIDARGRVTEATVLEVRPSTEHDAAIRVAATSNLLEWRFAPARKDGVAVESTLGWRVQFQTAAAGAQESSTSADPFAAVLQDPRVHRAQISDLPREQRGEYLDRYARVAEKNIDRSKRTRFDGPRFIVVTDAGNEKTAEVLAGNLEATFQVLHGIFDQHVAPEPQPLKLVAYLFASDEAFDAFRAEMGVTIGAAGFYLTPGVFAFHSELPTQQDLLSVMLHETVHAYSDAHLRRPGVLLPLWIEEGLAEYFGNSMIEKKQLQPGKTLRGTYVHTHYGGAFRTSSSRWSADNVRRAVRSGKAPSLPDVLQATHPVFYGEQAELYYSLSWILVHFLRHGEEAWADDKFPELVLYLVEGYDAGAALRAVYELPEAELAARFEKYARAF